MIAYTYSSATRQYVHPTTGRFVPRKAVRDALDAAIDVAQGEIEATAKRLQAGKINTSQFFLDVLAQTKRVIVASAALAVGGTHAMTPAILGRAGAAVRVQADYLHAFSRELAAGLPLDGRFLSRAAMYGESGRVLYEAIVRDQDIKAGMRWERRVLGGEIDRSCQACRDEAAKGWRPAGELAAIGSLSCLTRCRCTLIRQKTKPGDAMMSDDVRPADELAIESEPAENAESVSTDVEFTAMPANTLIESPAAVCFSTTIPTTHRRTENGFNIYPDAILFECGEYDSHKFAMTEAEAAQAVSRFAAPIGGNIEHTKFMRGRACEVRSIRIDPDDPKIIRGEVAVPAAFDAHLLDEERRVSCEWDRVTKELTGLALTVDPRIKKAALVAAFAAHEATAEDVAAFAAELGDAEPEIIAAFATPRKRDPELSGQMQDIHDVVAMRHPWACGGMGDGKGSPASFGDKPKQFKAVKNLHDLTTEHGAKCPGSRSMFSQPRSGASSTNPSGSRPMTELSKKKGMLAGLFSLFSTDEGKFDPEKFNTMIDDDTADKWLGDLTRDGAAATGDQKVEDAKTAAVAQFNLADAPEFKALQESLEAEKAKNKRLADAIEANRVKAVRDAAANFASEAVKRHKADAVEFNDLVDDYIEAAEADHASGNAVVTFSNVKGETVEGSRVQKLAAKVDRRPAKPGFEPTNLDGTRRLVEGDTILFSNPAPVDPDAAARAEADALLASTPAGRDILAKRRAN